MESQSKPRRSRSRSSSSDDEKKKPKAPSGPPSLHYQITYQQSALVVTIIECKVCIKKEKKHQINFNDLKNLKKSDLGGGAPDGMVEVYLLPGNNKPEKTKVVKNSLHPVFNENFRFQVFHIVLSVYNGV